MVFILKKKEIHIKTRIHKQNQTSNNNIYTKIRVIKTGKLLERKIMRE